MTEESNQLPVYLGHLVVKPLLKVKPRQPGGTGKRAGGRKDYFQKNKEKIYERVNKWRLTNADKQREYHREYYRLNKSKRQAQMRSYGTRSVCKDDLKSSCRKTFKAAVRSGKIIRPSKCSMCSCECRPDGHHRNYHEPFNVMWLCKTCHGAQHRLENRIK